MALAPRLPPLENRPRGPRRVLQKIWADKDLRDSLIEQLDSLLGSQASSWGATVRIDARESGTVEVHIEAHRDGTHRRPLTDAPTKGNHHENCRKEDPR